MENPGTRGDHVWLLVPEDAVAEQEHEDLILGPRIKRGPVQEFSELGKDGIIDGLVDPSELSALDLIDKDTLSFDIEAMK
jgi:hypothetical protein